MEAIYSSEMSVHIHRTAWCITEDRNIPSDTSSHSDAWKNALQLQLPVKMPSCALKELSWVELSLSYGRRSVDQFILVSGSPLGPMTRFYPYPFFSDNCFVVLSVGRPLWWEDGSVTYSAIADRSGHWEPITILYRLIWDYALSSSPLTTRRDYSGGILTCLHTGWTKRHINTILSDLTGNTLHLRYRDQPVNAV
jgi:hypothetical protein